MAIQGWIKPGAPAAPQGWTVTGKVADEDRNLKGESGGTGSAGARTQPPPPTPHLNCLPCRQLVAYYLSFVPLKMLTPRAGAAKDRQARGHAAWRQGARGRGAVRGAEHGPGRAFSAVLTALWTPWLRKAGSPLSPSFRAAAQAPSLRWCPECGVPFLESSGHPG